MVLVLHRIIRSAGTFSNFLPLLLLLYQTSCHFSCYFLKLLAISLATLPSHSAMKGLTPLSTVILLRTQSPRLVSHGLAGVKSRGSIPGFCPRCQDMLPLQSLRFKGSTPYVSVKQWVFVLPFGQLSIYSSNYSADILWLRPGSLGAFMDTTSSVSYNSS